VHDGILIKRGSVQAAKVHHRHFLGAGLRLRRTPYDFLDSYGVFNSRFSIRNGLGTARPNLRGKLMGNSGTEGAPRGDGPSLKVLNLV
jgi:hypothetical protein